MEESKSYMPMNLQYFAEEGGDAEEQEFGAYDPSTVYDGIEGAEPSADDGETVEAQDDGSQGEQQQDEQVQDQQEEQYLDFGGRKIPASEELKGLHQDFTEQQRYIQQQQEQLKHYQQLVQYFQQNQQQPNQQTQQQDQQVDPEQFMEKFYDDPVGQIKSLIEQSVTPIVEPIKEQQQITQEVQGMYQKYNDFGQYTDDIRQVIQQNPELAERPGGLEDAYFRAKAIRLSNQPSPDQLLNDPNFQNAIMQNEQIRNQIVNQYLGEKQQQRQQVPPVMGNQAGGKSPRMPENAPKTLREGTRMFMRNMGVNN